MYKLIDKKVFGILMILIKSFHKFIIIASHVNNELFNYYNIFNLNKKGLAISGTSE